MLLKDCLCLVLMLKIRKSHSEILIFRPEHTQNMETKSFFSFYLYIPSQVPVNGPSQEQKHLAYLHIPSYFYDKAVGEAHTPTLHNLLTHWQILMLHMK